MAGEMEVSLSDMLEQAQNSSDARESDERKWVPNHKNKDRGSKVQTREVEQRYVEKLIASQDKF